MLRELDHWTIGWSLIIADTSLWSCLILFAHIFKVSNPMLVETWSGSPADPAVRPALSPRSTNRSMPLGVGAQEVGDDLDLSHHQAATRDKPLLRTSMTLWILIRCYGMVLEFRIWFHKCWGRFLLSHAGTRTLQGATRNCHVFDKCGWCRYLCKSVPVP